jgi:UDPglucose 6-dehydrogenase
VERANERQKHVLVDKIVARFGNDLAGRTFAMWGLAFKPNTDDMRDAPSGIIITELTRRGAKVCAYDPVAMAEAKRLFGEVPGLAYCEKQEDALAGADALVVVTEWKEFRNPDFDGIKAALKQPLIFDGRNIYDPALMHSLGIDYSGIGRAKAR